MENFNEFATKDDELYAVEATQNGIMELFFVAATDDLGARNTVADTTSYIYQQTRAVTAKEYIRSLMLTCQSNVAAMGDIDEALIAEE